MKLLIFLVGWCGLLLLCWPLAFLVLILAPVIWLISWPVRLLALCFEAVFGLVRGLLLLPARLLGVRPR